MNGDGEDTGVVEPPAQQFVSDLGAFEDTGAWIWWTADECIEVSDLEPGQFYYERTVTYGPWIKKAVT